MLPINHILCAVDYSRTSWYAFEYAYDTAVTRNASLTVIHVVNTNAEISSTSFKQLEEELSNWVAAKNPEKITIKQDILFGIPYTEILEAINYLKPDLVVLGNKGHNIHEHFFIGHVAEKVLNLTDLPVLLIKARKENQA
ncbi:universal stress protein [Parasediminibacterium sp. JCM 36343]|uniref:universal stress protein n=1 Tax=Parasediminibacterium sp. JCM 36343 TaxID=3374279 RepID=UPI003978D939